jgi:hypothetical protein
VNVSSEIKLDFTGTYQLAANMRTAATQTGKMRRDLSDIQRDSQKAARSLAVNQLVGTGYTGQLRGKLAEARQPGRATPDSGTAGRAALFGTAAAGSAFFYRATALANPAATDRFHMAVNDATAVIGHKMIPALELLTRKVRGIGDYLANHPTVASAIGYGAIGLTGLAAAGTLYGVGKFAYAGLNQAGRDVGGALGITSRAAIAGDVAADSAALAAAGKGRKGKLGRAANTGAIIGTAVGALIVGDILADELKEARRGPLDQHGKAREFKQDWVDRRLEANLPAESKWALSKLGIRTSKEEFERQQKSSMGAAARPAEYLDAIESFFSMRQQIASGSSWQDDMKRTADATEAIADAVTKNPPAADSNFRVNPAPQSVDKSGGMFGKSNDRTTKR